MPTCLITWYPRRAFRLHSTHTLLPGQNSWMVKLIAMLKGFDNQNQRFRALQLGRKYY